MTRTQERAIRKAIRDKIGDRLGVCEAYCVQEYGDDVDAGCDAKVELAMLELSPGDHLDVYVFYPVDDRYRFSGDLNCNVEVRLDDDLNVVAVLTTADLIAEEKQRIDNYDGPDDTYADAWSGGFADNH